MDVMIVAPADDLHALSVAREVQRSGGSAAVLDLRDFPARAHLNYSLGPSRSAAIITHEQFGEVDLTGLRSVWWRRAHPIDPEFVPHPTLRRFVAFEWQHAATGALVASVRRFVNPLDAGRLAVFKPYQLRLAQQVGLPIPETAITNSPSVVDDLAERCHDIVYKTLTGTEFGFYETRPLLPEDRADLQRVEGCPAIFQQRIDGEYDVRATVVGNEVYSARIDYTLGDHPIDWRACPGVPVSRIDLDDNTTKRLIDLTERLGLRYGAIDLRYSKDAGYTFFELNPDGQFLWIEIETGLPISRALAAELLRA